MKRYLIRAGTSPFESNTAVEVMDRNLIGGNVGNLIYQNSIFRTLQTQDVVIEPDRYVLDPSLADEINEKYDGYIIPLADAFRDKFAPNLERYAELINQLKIPVYVIGVGLRAPFEPKLNEGFEFDESVKKFVKAVLNKSECIGLRGQITSDYLTKLGFKEGVDHQVIGCPSMYTFGRELKIRDTVINRNSKISINNSKISPKNLLDFLENSQQQFDDITFIPQWLKELALTYYGVPALENSNNANYPVDSTHRFYMEGRTKYFLSAHDWIEFLKTVDLSYGARLHGNITATIAGTPSILFPKDARMRELAEYHNLTHVMANEVKGNTNIFDLVEKVDFHSPEKVQAKNFDHFIAFLEKNNLSHVYQQSEPVQFEEQVKSSEIVNSILTVSKEEQIKRLNDFNNAHKQSLKQARSQIKSLTNDNVRMEKELKHKNATLQRRSIKTALTVADKIAQMKKK